MENQVKAVGQTQAARAAHCCDAAPRLLEQSTLRSASDPPADATDSIGKGESGCPGHSQTHIAQVHQDLVMFRSAVFSFLATTSLYEKRKGWVCTR